jgi:hypothetical protein
MAVALSAAGGTERPASEEDHRRGPDRDGRSAAAGVERSRARPFCFPKMSSNDDVFSKDRFPLSGRGSIGEAQRSPLVRFLTCWGLECRCGSGGLVCSSYLLHSVPAVRQKRHLSPCPIFRSHLSSRFTDAGVRSKGGKSHRSTGIQRRATWTGRGAPRLHLLSRAGHVSPR